MSRKTMEKTRKVRSEKMNIKKQAPSKLILTTVNLEAKKKSEPIAPTSPKLQRANTKPSSGRSNTSCLCSPTTHAGSFRCRFHRTPGTMFRGHSVGSNLSEWAAPKSPS